MKSASNLSLVLSALCTFFCVGSGNYSGDGLWAISVTEYLGYIEISGKSGNSGLILSRVSVKKHKKDLLLKCHYHLMQSLPSLELRKKQKGISDFGLTNYQVQVPPSVDRVLLGKEGVVIWTRVRQPNSSEDPKSFE